MPSEIDVGAGLDPARLLGGRTNAPTGTTGTTTRAVRKGRPELCQDLDPRCGREYARGPAGAPTRVALAAPDRPCGLSEHGSPVHATRSSRLVALPDCSHYRPRQPRATPLYRLVDARNDEVHARRRAVNLAGPQHGAEDTAPIDPDRRALRRMWAALIRRICEVDPLVCPRSGGTMRIIAFITEPRVIGTILRHLAAKGVDARNLPGADPFSLQRTATAA